MIEKLANELNVLQVRAETVPTLLSGVSRLPPQHQDMLLRMAAKVDICLLSHVWL